MTESTRIYNQLVAEAEQHGTAAVRDAMKKFEKSQLNGKRPIGKTWGIGPHTKRWNQAREVLRRLFDERGIKSCEVFLAGVCGVTFGLSFAHSRKRRHLSDEELCTSVVLACGFCHQILDEVYTADEMYNTVELLIEQRGWRPAYDEFPAKGRG